MIKVLFPVMAAISLSFSIAAQVVNSGDLPQDQQTKTPLLLNEAKSDTNWQSGRYGPDISSKTITPLSKIKPFGADLFAGGFRGLRADGLNSNYKILPGDQVTLRVWGAVDIDRILPVDAQGNIFIPSIGPVPVMGMSHANLDQTVRAAVKKVYPDNVNVYTNLQGVQPVAVFVAGFVNRPGRYAGVPSDSLLFFIDQAAGIDEQLGSYRQVSLVRNGIEIAKADLYDFILQGRLTQTQFQDGDTIFVSKRGPAVIVQGDVGRPYRYELQSEEPLTGNSVNQLARLKSGVNQVLVRGTRDSGKVVSYLGMDEFARYQLADGDEVIYIADQQNDNIVVQLEGGYLGQSRFVVPKETQLLDLLKQIQLDPVLADGKSISVKRISIAERQKAALEDSLRRLESTYLGASSATNEESAIRVREAELISQFVKKAREVQPNGRLVVANEGQIQDVRLQDGDIITIPQKSDAILISGEVFVPQSVVFSKRKDPYDYIEGAGGFTPRADEDMILILKPNGEVRYADDVDIEPGDEILVLPEADTKNLQLASSITQILYQIAVATKVALDL
ncbi:polysaccharide biosynthesis/export family protein [Rheinheimera mangrovi]|uniref:polysaccharide biosynthesis/export family protein n=1 Tax=Rheinheimera mangrovi TaxID=2498451 RepID=UPI001E329243|nr:polysaccharide biosynthesis/export family protein [Rheinheimera mangrovi]